MQINHAQSSTTQSHLSVDTLESPVSIAPINEAVRLHQQGNVQAAQQIYEEILQNDPQHFDAKHLLGVVYLQNCRYEEALQNIQEALAIKPDNAAAYSNLGRVLHESKRWDEAVTSYDQAIRLQPNFAEAHYNKGNALRELKKFDDAIASYEAAIQHKHHYAEAYQNLGVIAQELRQIDKAIAHYDQAIALKPNSAETHSNRGVALKAIHRIEEAIQAFDQAIALQPNYAQAYWNKSITLLLSGQYEEGWQLFEWGWAAKQRGTPRHLEYPLWTGVEPLNGKTILLHAEQGYGDDIQCCRYAKLVHDLGATVILEVPTLLVDLFKGLEGVTTVIAQGQPINHVDYQCPLMTLPLAFKTSLTSIPTQFPYLHADSTKSEHWKHKLQPFTQKKIGLVWNGGFRPNQPESWQLNAERNVALDEFAKHLSHPNFAFISLQKGDPAESEIRGQEDVYWPQGNFHNFANELHSFSDTAALISNLDLVISVDTSTAHLAAAMGKPVWILNRYDNCWRWLLDTEHSPWYPSVRLYRQGPERKWQPVLQQVASDLLNL